MHENLPSRPLSPGIASQQPASSFLWVLWRPRVTFSEAEIEDTNILIRSLFQQGILAEWERLLA
jgi:hypothetical protein